MAETKRTSPAHAKKSSKNKKRSNKGFIIFSIVFLSVLGLLFTAVSGALWYFQYDRNDALDALSDAELGVDSSLSDDVTNIALFGIDTRNVISGTRGNSDSIMILSIDKAHNTIKITSVMRDMLTPIEGRGANKINAAYAYGGPELAIKTLNQIFNLNIRDYATVNFAGMADIIDAMGGIEVNITEAERQNANEHIRWLSVTSGTPNTQIKKAGKQTLSGVQAVAFARIRYVSTSSGVRDDYGRTDRQRYVMEQLFNKAMSMGKSKYPSVIKALLPHMETSLTYADILSMSGILTGDISFKQARIPQGYAMQISNRDFPTSLGAALYINLDYAAEMLHGFIYDDIHPDDYIKQYPADTTPWYSAWKAGNWEP